MVVCSGKERALELHQLIASFTFKSRQHSRKNIGSRPIIHKNTHTKIQANTRILFTAATGIIAFRCSGGDAAAQRCWSARVNRSGGNVLEKSTAYNFPLSALWISTQGEKTWITLITRIYIMCMRAYLYFLEWENKTSPHFALCCMKNFDLCFACVHGLEMCFFFIYRITYPNR